MLFNQTSEESLTKVVVVVYLMKNKLVRHVRRIILAN